MTNTLSDREESASNAASGVVVREHRDQRGHRILDLSRKLLIDYPSACFSLPASFCLLLLPRNRIKILGRGDCESPLDCAFLRGVKSKPHVVQAFFLAGTLN